MTLAALFQVPAPGAPYTEVKLTPAAQQRVDECDRLHGELRRNNADVRALREAWRGEQKRCAGTGIYEYLLGNDERNAGDSKAAAGIFADAVRRKLPYWEKSYVMLNTLQGEAALRQQPPDLERLRALRDELAKFAVTHQADAFAYQQLAAVDVTLKDWPAAIDAARKSNEVDRMYGRASRYLVLALHQSERCAEVVQEVQPAIDNSRELLADRDFMLPVSDCLAQTGDPKNGEKALQALLRENPALKDDPQVLQLQKYFAVTNKSQ